MTNWNFSPRKAQAIRPRPLANVPDAEPEHVTGWRLALTWAVCILGAWAVIGLLGWLAWHYPYQVGALLCLAVGMYALHRRLQDGTSPGGHVPPGG